MAASSATSRPTTRSSVIEIARQLLAQARALTPDPVVLVCVDDPALLDPALTDLLVFARHHGAEIVEVTEEAEERWSSMIDRAAAETPFGTIGQYVGGNIPGKPKRYLLNAGGRPKLLKDIARAKADGYAAFGLG